MEDVLFGAAAVATLIIAADNDVAYAAGIRNAANQKEKLSAFTSSISLCVVYLSASSLLCSDWNLCCVSPPVDSGAAGESPPAEPLHR